MKFIALVSTIALGMTTACATVESIPLPAESEDQSGFIYYEPEPYLLVRESVTTVKQKEAKTSTVEVSIIYLPNRSKRRALKVTGGWGSVTFKPSFDKGWNLTGFDASVDSQFDETLAALASLVEVLPLGDKARVDGEKVFPPGLYRIIWKDGLIKGFERVSFSPAKGAVSQ